MSDTGPAPRATVVITTHDRPGYARRAIRSALVQTSVTVEVVVVDDGSVPPFEAGLDDERLRVLLNDHRPGVSGARNCGLAAARGEWVTFLDDDDELVPDMLAVSLAAAEGSSLPEPVVTMSAMSIVDGDGTEIERCDPPTLHRGEHFFLEGRGDRAKNTLVMPTSVVRGIGGWGEHLQAYEADDFGLRLNRVASIQGIDEVLYLMTRHGGPRLTARVGDIPYDMQTTLREHRAAFRHHRSGRAHYMSTIGMYHLRSGRWGPAVWWCGRGVACDPRRLRRWLFLGAALAGPRVVTVYRRVRGRESGVSMWVLTKRRARKYLRRLANHPRALAGLPLGALTRGLLRRSTRGAEARSRSVLLVSIYRARNAAHLERLVDEARAHDWTVRLWTLDDVAPALAPHTIGTSTGPKFPLLNELVAAQDLDGFDWVVVADDDFVFRSGSLDELLALAEAADLDLVQPAHDELSYRDNEITVRRQLSVARRTTFVEIGPVFVVRRPWITKVLPFPSEHTMGWGLELEWADLAGAGARLGILDAVTIRHLQPVGKGYAKRAENDHLKELLRARGLVAISDIQRTIGTWRPWRSAPPWAS